MNNLSPTSIQVEIISLNNIKKQNQMACDNVLLPTKDGIKFIDNKSREIITDVTAGILKLNNLDQCQEFILENNGIAYWNKEQLTIIVN